MNSLNPLLQRQVETLADLCCQLLRGENVDGEEIQTLIEALVRNGFARLSDVSLQIRLEEEVITRCQETAIHRRDELTGITAGIQSKFADLVLWTTRSPQDPKEAKTR